MKSTFRSLLAATGLGLALASPFAIAQPAQDPADPSVAAPSAAAPSASQGRQGRHGHHGEARGEGRHGQKGQQGQHAGRHGRDAMSQADRDARRAAMDKLTTPEERTAFREKMRSATPEQRPQLMAARRAELEQRATERGVTLPVMQPRGGQATPAPGATPPAQPAAPAMM